MASSACPGCGVVLPETTGPTHAYIGASPACWEQYGAVLAREYSQVVPWEAHPTTVDAYAAQHPGVESRRATQSVAVHLMALCLAFERQGTREQRLWLLGQAAAQPPGTLRWLERPGDLGAVTVLDVLERDPDDHLEAVTSWARSVYDAWEPHHRTVRAWLDEVLTRAR